ncbi:MAG: hypothetical protein K2Q01_04335 [Rickettsiales bacterium]|nr:hypothetical protein [Rickettsiales bacterium]
MVTNDNQDSAKSLPADVPGLDDFLKEREPHAPVSPPKAVPVTRKDAASDKALTDFVNSLDDPNAPTDSGAVHSHRSAPEPQESPQKKSRAPRWIKRGLLAGTAAIASIGVIDEVTKDEPAERTAHKAKDTSGALPPPPLAIPLYEEEATPHADQRHAGQIELELLDHQFKLTGKGASGSAIPANDLQDIARRIKAKTSIGSTPVAEILSRNFGDTASYASYLHLTDQSNSDHKGESVAHILVSNGTGFSSREGTLRFPTHRNQVLVALDGQYYAGLKSIEDGCLTFHTGAYNGNKALMQYVRIKGFDPQRDNLILMAMPGKTAASTRPERALDVLMNDNSFGGAWLVGSPNYNDKLRFTPTHLRVPIPQMQHSPKWKALQGFEDVKLEDIPTFHVLPLSEKERSVIATPGIYQTTVVPGTHGKSLFHGRHSAGSTSALIMDTPAMPRVRGAPGCGTYYAAKYDSATVSPDQVFGEKYQKNGAYGAFDSVPRNEIATTYREYLNRSWSRVYPDDAGKVSGLTADYFANWQATQLAQGDELTKIMRRSIRMEKPVAPTISIRAPQHDITVSSMNASDAELAEMMNMPSEKTQGLYYKATEGGKITGLGPIHIGRDKKGSTAFIAFEQEVRGSPEVRIEKEHSSVRDSLGLQKTRVGTIMLPNMTDLSKVHVVGRQVDLLNTQGQKIAAFDLSRVDVLRIVDPGVKLRRPQRINVGEDDERVVSPPPLTVQIDSNHKQKGFIAVESIHDWVHFDVTNLREDCKVIMSSAPSPNLSYTVTAGADRIAHTAAAHGHIAFADPQAQPPARVLIYSAAAQTPILELKDGFARTVGSLSLNAEDAMAATMQQFSAEFNTPPLNVRGASAAALSRVRSVARTTEQPHR